MKLHERVSEHAEARANINTFYAVIGLLENGTIRGSHPTEVAERIIRQCKSAALRELERMDKHMDAIKDGWDQ